MTSEPTLPHLLTQIDALTRPDHGYLATADDCYFLGEYTARQGFGFSPMNRMIFNFKKSVAKLGTPEWRYKEQALQQAAAAFRQALGEEWLDAATLIPIPPSKAKTDPLYDDRLLRLLQAIRSQPPLDIRELIIQTTSTAAAHGSTIRLRPEQLAALYTLNPSLIAPPPRFIGLCDDVLTTGCHFKAAQARLATAFPAVPVIGLFIARRAPNTMDLDS